MKRDATVFCASSYGYEFYNRLGLSGTTDPDKADIIAYFGGADISPELYNEKKHHTTINSPDRDAYEAGLFRKYVGQKAFIGICRGGQLLTALNGDRLYQNVDGHRGPHTAYIVQHTDRGLVRGEQVLVTSTHHQQFRLNPGSEAQLLLVSANTTFREADGFVDGNVQYDPNDLYTWDFEALWYPTTRSLAFQPHPEFSPGDRFNDSCFSVFATFIDDYVLPSVWAERANRTIVETPPLLPEATPLLPEERTIAKRQYRRKPGNVNN